jgi:hypothetical protein
LQAAPAAAATKTMATRIARAESDILRMIY